MSKMPPSPSPAIEAEAEAHAMSTIIQLLYQHPGLAQQVAAAAASAMPPPIPYAMMAPAHPSLPPMAMMPPPSSILMPPPMAAAAASSMAHPSVPMVLAPPHVMPPPMGPMPPPPSAMAHPPPSAPSAMAHPSMPMAMMPPPLPPPMAAAAASAIPLMPPSMAHPPPHGMPPPPSGMAHPPPSGMAHLPLPPPLETTTAIVAVASSSNASGKKRKTSEEQLLNLNPSNAVRHDEGEGRLPHRIHLVDMLNRALKAAGGPSEVWTKEAGELFETNRFDTCNHLKLYEGDDFCWNDLNSDQQAKFGKEFASLLGKFGLESFSVEYNGELIRVVQIQVAFYEQFAKLFGIYTSTHSATLNFSKKVRRYRDCHDPDVRVELFQGDKVVELYCDNFIPGPDGAAATMKLTMRREPTATLSEPKGDPHEDAEPVKGIITAKWERMTLTQLIAECVRLNTVSTQRTVKKLHNVLATWLNKKLLRTANEVEGLKQLYAISEEDIQSFLQRSQRAEPATEPQIQEAKDILAARWGDMDGGQLLDECKRLNAIGEPITVGKNKIVDRLLNRLTKWLNNKALCTTEDINDILSVTS